MAHKWKWDEEYLNNIIDQVLYPERYRGSEDVITLITNYIIDIYKMEHIPYSTIWQIVSTSDGYNYGFTKHTKKEYKRDIKKIIQEVKLCIKYIGEIKCGKKKISNNHYRLLK